MTGGASPITTGQDGPSIRKREELVGSLGTSGKRVSLLQEGKRGKRGDGKILTEREEQGREEVVITIYEEEID